MGSHEMGPVLYSTECVLEFLVWWDVHSEILAGNAERKTVGTSNEAWTDLFDRGKSLICFCDAMWRCSAEDITILNNS